MEISAILKAHRSTGTVKSASVDPKRYWRVITGYHNLSQAAAPMAVTVPSIVAQWDQTTWQLNWSMCSSPSNQKRGLEFLTTSYFRHYIHRDPNCPDIVQAKLLHYLCCIILFKEETLIKTLCTTEDPRKPPRRFRNLPRPRVSASPAM